MRVTGLKIQNNLDPLFDVVEGGDDAYTEAYPLVQIAGNPLVAKLFFHIYIYTYILRLYMYKVYTCQNDRDVTLVFLIFSYFWKILKNGSPKMRTTKILFCFFSPINNVTPVFGPVWKLFNFHIERIVKISKKYQQRSILLIYIFDDQTKIIKKQNMKIAIKCFLLFHLTAY